MRPVREKSHRLRPELYRGTCVVSITICLKPRISFFVTEKLFRLFENVLLTELANFRCSSDVYLFMPDHGHVIIRGLDESSDTLKPLRAFKQKTGFAMRSLRAPVKWQKDFYDHIIREDESVDKHIRYILENPVRKGLVNDWRLYPFKGSTTLDLDNWVDW
ncbi:MAG: transposase [Ignavibacteriales bacterium]|nr:transposase [Ignavibacteriales bacterium]